MKYATLIRFILLNLKVGCLKSKGTRANRKKISSFCGCFSGSSRNVDPKDSLILSQDRPDPRIMRVFELNQLTTHGLAGSSGATQYFDKSGGMGVAWTAQT